MLKKKIKKRGTASIKDLCEYFGVVRMTILYWRKHKNLKWYYMKKSKEYGSRNEVYFLWKEVIEWANENHIRIKAS